MVAFFTAGSMVQLVMSILISVVAMVYHIHAKPFTDTWLNVMQGLCLFMIWLTLQAGLMVSQTTVPDASTGNALLVALSVANIFLLISPVCMMAIVGSEMLPPAVRRRIMVFTCQQGAADEDLVRAVASDADADTVAKQSCPQMADATGHEFQVELTTSMHAVVAESDWEALDVPTASAVASLHSAHDLEKPGLAATPTSTVHEQVAAAALVSQSAIEEVRERDTMPPVIDLGATRAMDADVDWSRMTLNPLMLPAEPAT